MTMRNASLLYHVFPISNAELRTNGNVTHCQLPWWVLDLSHSPPQRFVYDLGFSPKGKELYSIRKESIPNYKILESRRVLHMRGKLLYFLHDLEEEMQWPDEELPAYDQNVPIVTTFRDWFRMWNV